MKITVSHPSELLIECTINGVPISNISHTKGKSIFEFNTLYNQNCFCELEQKGSKLNTRKSILGKCDLLTGYYEIVYANISFDVKCSETSELSLSTNILSSQKSNQTGKYKFDLSNSLNCKVSNINHNMFSDKIKNIIRRNDLLIAIIELLVFVTFGSILIVFCSWGIRPIG